MGRPEGVASSNSECTEFSAKSTKDTAWRMQTRVEVWLSGMGCLRAREQEGQGGAVTTRGCWMGSLNLDLRPEVLVFTGTSDLLAAVVLTVFSSTF